MSWSKTFIRHGGDRLEQDGEGYKNESRTVLHSNQVGQGSLPRQTLRGVPVGGQSRALLFHANDILLRNLHANKIHNGGEQSNTGSFCGRQEWSLGAACAEGRVRSQLPH